MAVCTRAKRRKKEKDVVGKEFLPLPEDLYIEVAKHVHESEALAFAMTCRGFRDAMKEVSTRRMRESGNTSGKWLTTRMMHYRKVSNVPVSRDWIKWAFSVKCYGVREDEQRHFLYLKKGLFTYIAARGGYKDVLGWLKKQGCVFDVDTCGGAARGGHIKLLKYLNSEGLQFGPWTCRSAALGGHIKVLKYLKSEGVSFYSGTCSGAAQGGHINVLRYLKSEGVRFDSYTSEWASLGGQIDVLKYLKSEGVSFGSFTCNRAAAGGHLEILKYLKSEGVTFDQNICEWAATGGHIKVLKYLQSEGMPFNESTCAGAARGGQLHILKWLRSEEVNSPWNVRDCLHAAEYTRQRDEGTSAWIKSFLDTSDVSVSPTPQF